MAIVGIYLGYSFTSGFLNGMIWGVFVITPPWKGMSQTSHHQHSIMTFFLRVGDLNLNLHLQRSHPGGAMIHYTYLQGKKQ